MDSNTITFDMLPSRDVQNGSSPQMIDEMRSSKEKSTSDDSTNFIEYQEFKKASSSTKCGDSGNHDSFDKNSGHSTKTKIIQKQHKISKES